MKESREKAEGREFDGSREKAGSRGHSKALI
jgi:hypothetical protein